MTAYVTLSEFKSYLRNELSAVDDIDLTEALTSASDAIGDYCGRTFTAAGTAATARVYVPTWDTELYIDDATTVTAVSVSGTALAATAFQKEPLNALVNGQASPYTKLVRLGGEMWSGNAYDDEAVVSVTATWGWPAVPSRVVSATKILAKEIAETRNQMGGYVSFGDMAARAVTHPKYRQMLDRLQRYDRTVGVG